MTTVAIKEFLYQECMNKVQGRFEKIKQTISDLDESLTEGNDSGGEDGFDNSRAMMQIDRENANKQLGEVLVLKEVLKRLDVKLVTDYARLGSLIRTNRSIYFISLSIGTVILEHSEYLCVALHSPIGNVLSGKRLGDKFIFNQNEQEILEIK